MISLDQILEESELLGVEMKLPDYFDRLYPSFQDRVVAGMFQALQKTKRAQFITHTHISEENRRCQELCFGHGGKGRIIALRPIQTTKYTIEQMEREHLIGLYDHVLSVRT